jgi:hypothetical protein
MLAILGILMCAAMIEQVDLGQSRILVATVGAAMLNWAWVRWIKRST